MSPRSGKVPYNHCCLRDRLMGDRDSKATTAATARSSDGRQLMATISRSGNGLGSNVADRSTETSVRAALWIALLCGLVPVVCLAIPMYVIRPFRPQAAD